MSLSSRGNGPFLDFVSSVSDPLPVLEILPLYDSRQEMNLTLAVAQLVGALSPYTERLWVQYPVRACTKLVSPFPVGEHIGDNPSMFLSQIDVFLFLFLSLSLSQKN